MKRPANKILFAAASILLAAAVAGMSGVLGPDLKPPSVPADFDGEGIPIYDTRPPALPPLGDEAILVFSKTTWFHDDKSIQAAVEALKRIANSNGWSVFATENGGGFVGVHGSEGDPKYAWKWYVETLIGAQFRVHSSIRPTTIHIEDANDPAPHGLPQKWTRTDEWYAFTENPRPNGVHLLVTVDEKTYNTMGGRGENGSMGADHPVVWKHCVGKGRSFVNAMGHSASVYNEPLYLQMLQGSISWAMGLEGEGCPATVAR